MRRFFGFAGISGLGWLIDLSLFSLLSLATDLGPFAANLLSAGVAVTFVYFASARHVFRYRGGYLLAKLLAYIAFNVLAITAASAAIGLLASAISGPLGELAGKDGEALAGLLAKIAVTPLTLAANFAFSRVLLGRTRPAPGGMQPGVSA